MSLLLTLALAALATGALLHWAPWGARSALPSASARSLAPSHATLLSLPLAAQGPVSAGLGGDEPAYRLRGLSAPNPAQRLHVSFSSQGLSVASAGGHLRMTLSGFGYQSALRALGPAAPQVKANRVGYRHGALREWYANGPLGLEQGFDLKARPRAGSGPLTFSLALSGNLHPLLKDGSLLLSGHGANLAYRGLIATDAHGRALRSSLQLQGASLLVRVDDRGASYPIRVDPFIQQAELTASDGAPFDVLGYSVAISGNTIVAGAFGHKVGANAEQGAAYVFQMPPAGWAGATQTAELTGSDGSPSDELGVSVAISGNTIVAGAPRHKVGSNATQGAAYVFQMPPAGWASATQTAELTGSDGAPSDELGVSVAISGNTIVAGALNHKVGSNAEQGAACVFQMPPAGWASATQTAELTASDGEASDFLGLSVAISGNTIVAGALNHKVGSNGSQGAAYVFQMPPAGWASATQTAELTASDGEAGDGLGVSVAISGNTIVAGAYEHKVGSNARQGAAYVFQMPPAGWAGASQTAELTASDGVAGDQLGDSVAISGNTIVAGPTRHKVGSQTEQGAAYVFQMPPAGWAGATQTAELTASDGVAGDQFGFSVAISGNTILAGAPHHMVGSNSLQGAAYAFVVPAPTVTVTTPANGASYTQGEVLAASYTCSASSPLSVTACTGPLANGAAIDTSSLGTHTFRVNATDSDGQGASQSASYTVIPPPALLSAPLALAISAVNQTARTWVAGSALAKITATKALPVGSTFSFTLNEPAKVGFAFTTSAPGRRVGKACAAPTRANRHKHSCTRTVKAGALAFQGHTGVNKVRFQGVISKRQKLAPGTYTLTITATAPGQHAVSATLHFTIAQPPPRKERH